MFVSSLVDEVPAFVDEVPASDMFLFLWLKCNPKDQLVVVIQLLMFRGVSNGFSSFYMSALRDASILYRYEACVHTAVHISF